MSNVNFETGLFFSLADKNIKVWSDTPELVENVGLKADEFGHHRIAGEVADGARILVTINGTRCEQVSVTNGEVHYGEGRPEVMDDCTLSNSLEDIPSEIDAEFGTAYGVWAGEKERAAHDYLAEKLAGNRKAVKLLAFASGRKAYASHAAMLDAWGALSRWLGVRVKLSSYRTAAVKVAEAAGWDAQKAGKPAFWEERKPMPEGWVEVYSLEASQQAA